LIRFIHLSTTMEEEAVQEILVCSIIVSSCMVIESTNTKKRKRKCWVKDYFRERDEYGAYKLTLQELRLKDPYSFRQYLRMNTYVYEVVIYYVLVILCSTIFIWLSKTKKNSNISAGGTLF